MRSISAAIDCFPHSCLSSRRLPVLLRWLGVDAHARAAMVADALTNLLGLGPRSAVPLGVMAPLIVIGSGEAPVGKTPRDLVELKMASSVIRFP